jgi:hypothetical protein
MITDRQLENARRSLRAAIKAADKNLESSVDAIVQVCIDIANSAGRDSRFDDGRSVYVEDKTTDRIIDALRELKAQE